MPRKKPLLERKDHVAGVEVGSTPARGGHFVKISQADALAIIQAVAKFDTFDEDNDP